MMLALSILQNHDSRPSCTRVLIVSDVLLYREGLKASLAGLAGLEITNAVSGSEAIARTQALAPDVVLLDASLPDSLALAREMRRLASGVRIVGFGVNLAENRIPACPEAWPGGLVGRDGTV